MFLLLPAPQPGRLGHTQSKSWLGLSAAQLKRASTPSDSSRCQVSWLGRKERGGWGGLDLGLRWVVDAPVPADMIQPWLAPLVVCSWVHCYISPCLMLHCPAPPHPRPTWGLGAQLDICGCWSCVCASLSACRTTPTNCAWLACSSMRGCRSGVIAAAVSSHVHLHDLCLPSCCLWLSQSWTVSARVRQQQKTTTQR